MSTAIESSPAIIAHSAPNVLSSRSELPEQAIVLEAIEWQQYIALRDELANRFRA
jgi:hypothetical protein